VEKIRPSGFEGVVGFTIVGQVADSVDQLYAADLKAGC